MAIMDNFVISPTLKKTVEDTKKFVTAISNLPSEEISIDSQSLRILNELIANPAYGIRLKVTTINNQKLTLTLSHPPVEISASGYFQCGDVEFTSAGIRYQRVEQRSSNTSFILISIFAVIALINTARCLYDYQTQNKSGTVWNQVQEPARLT